MKRRGPTYDLKDVQEIVRDPKSRPFTRTALRGGTDLGLDEPGMRKVVLALRHSDFYKPMPAEQDPGYWQDVYHGRTPEGVAVYIKITLYTDGKPIVIQFKEK